MTKLFISYSRVDMHFVEELELRLSSQHELWVDQHLTGGQTWWDEILKQIEACDTFIYVLSNDSVSSEYCQREIDEALGLNKTIIPLLVRDKTNVPDKISHIQIINMITWVKNESAWEDLYKSLDENYIGQKLRQRRLRFGILVSVFALICIFGSAYLFQQTVQQNVDATASAEALIAGLSETPSVRINQGQLNAYLDPGNEFPLVTRLEPGESFAVSGISDDGKWYQIILTDDSFAWVDISSRLVEEDGSIISLPIVTNSPTWTATPTKTYTPSATATATATATYTATPTATYTATPTPTNTYTPTATATATATNTLTPTATATYTASPTPTNTLTPTPNIPLASIRVSRIAVRLLPGGSEQAGIAEAGELYLITGITEDGAWYRIELPDGTIGWVGSIAVEAFGPVDTIPFIAPPTPTATSVPTETPLPAISVDLIRPDNRADALQYSGFWQQESFDELTTPGTRTYNVVVNPDQPLRATTFWCADTEELLEENADFITVSHTIDDLPIPQGNYFFSENLPSGIFNCNFWDVIIGGWRHNRPVSYKMHISIIREISDGYKSFPAGEYIHEIIIHPDRDVFMCDNGIPSRLSIGENVRITGRGSNLRISASTDNIPVASAPSGGLLEIADGPVCEEGLIWWNVYYDTNPPVDETNLEEYYWVAETLDYNYLLEPLVMPSEQDEIRINPSPSQFELSTAYQSFENGHMFWLQTVQQIWVLYDDDDSWEIFNDKEERISNLEFNPPQGLLVPISGFGNIWKNNSRVRERLGWARIPEVGLINTFQYLPEEGKIILADDAGNPYYLYVNFRWEQSSEEE